MERLERAARRAQSLPRKKKKSLTCETIGAATPKHGTPTTLAAWQMREQSKHKVVPPNAGTPMGLGLFKRDEDYDSDEDKPKGGGYLPSAFSVQSDLPPAFKSAARSRSKSPSPKSLRARSKSPAVRGKSPAPRGKSPVPKQKSKTKSTTKAVPDKSDKDDEEKSPSPSKASKSTKSKTKSSAKPEKSKSKSAEDDESPPISSTAKVSKSKSKPGDDNGSPTKAAAEATKSGKSKSHSGDNDESPAKPVQDTTKSRSLPASPVAAGEDEASDISPALSEGVSVET